MPSSSITRIASRMVRKLDLIGSKTLPSPKITFVGTLESAKLSAVREAGAPFFSLPLVSCAPCRICERDQRTTSRGKWAAVTGEPSYDRKSDSCLTPSIKGGRRLRNGRYFGGRIQLRLGVYNRAVHFGLFREHQTWKAPVRVLLYSTLAGELVPQAQSAGH